MLFYIDVAAIRCLKLCHIVYLLVRDQSGFKRLVGRFVIWQNYIYIFNFAFVLNITLIRIILIGQVSFGVMVQFVYSDAKGICCFNILQA